MPASPSRGLFEFDDTSVEPKGSVHVLVRELPAGDQLDNPITGGGAAGANDSVVTVTLRITRAASTRAASITDRAGHAPALIRVEGGVRDGW